MGRSNVTINQAQQDSHISKTEETSSEIRGNTTSNIVKVVRYFADNGIFSIQTIGQGLKKLASEGNKVVLVNNWLYYSNGKNIYKMKKDGSNQTKLTKGKLVDVVDGKLYGILEKTLFKIDLNGGFRQEIYKFDEDIEEKYIIANGYIYFTDLHSICQIIT